MKNQNGKPENAGNERVLKIAEVCSPDSRRAPKNSFPDRDVLCSAAGEMRIRVDGVNPDKSAIVSVLDASGKEIERAEIAEGETKNVASRAITALGISLGLVAGACEYNYTYDYGNDEDAATNPPLVCPTVPVTDRCEGGDNPNKLSCTAYEGSAIDFDGYLFRVADVREESGVTKVYIDVLEQSLDCRLLHTLELTVGVENGFSVGTDSYTILPSWAEMGADPDAPAVVGLDITKTSIEPTPTVCPETTDRCEEVYGSPTAISCPVYEGLAAEINGVLVKIARLWEEGGVRKARLELYDRELGCADTPGVLELSEGENGEVGVGSKVFTIDVRGITLVGYGTNWASVVITDTTAAASCATISPDSCTTRPDSVRCEMPAGLVGIKLGTLVFTPYLGCDGGTVSIYDDTIPGVCVPVDHVEFSAIPGVMEYRYGAYYYRITVFGCSSDSARVDMQVERRALLCDGSEVTGIINVGEVVDSGVTGLKVRLDDISRDGEAILTILDRNWNEYMGLTLAESEARLIDYDGRLVVVSINDVAAGVLLISKWVDITVQTCE